MWDVALFVLQFPGLELESWGLWFGHQVELRLRIKRLRFDFVEHVKLLGTTDLIAVCRRSTSQKDAMHERAAKASRKQAKASSVGFCGDFIS